MHNYFRRIAGAPANTFFAAEEGLLKICERPLDIARGLGAGDTKAGIKYLANIGAAIKSSWNNIALLPTLQDTVGADTLWELIWEIEYPFWLCGIHFNNSATATTKVTDIKNNGFPMGNIGITPIQGTRVETLFSRIAQMDGVDWIWIQCKGSKLTLSGTATNADVVEVTPYGINMQLMKTG